jgi:hypothetical protein
MVSGFFDRLLGNRSTGVFIFCGIIQIVPITEAYGSNTMSNVDADKVFICRKLQSLQESISTLIFTQKTSWREEQNDGSIREGGYVVKTAYTRKLGKLRCDVIKTEKISTGKQTPGKPFITTLDKKHNKPEPALVFALVDIIRASDVVLTNDGKTVTLKLSHRQGIDVYPYGEIKINAIGLPERYVIFGANGSVSLEYTIQWQSYGNMDFPYECEAKSYSANTVITRTTQYTSVLLNAALSDTLFVTP